MESDQLNRISKYIFLIFIFLSVIFASGCTGIGNLTENKTAQPQNVSQPITNNSSFATDIVVTVAYQGSWKGNISDNSGNRSVQGVGNNKYNLGPNPGTVSATFQKTGNDRLPLSAQILQGRNVIESQKNNESYGVVSITHVF